MDNHLPSVQLEEKSSKRGRLMGKLFGGKDKKHSGPGTDVEAFLQRTNSNTFSPTPPSSSPIPPPYMPSATPPTNVPPPPAPPRLALDTASASRSPAAVGAVDSFPLQQPLVIRCSPPSPKKSPRRNRKKGLTVRFADTFPEIMGEGGEESEFPTMEISRKKQAAIAAAAIAAASAAAAAWSPPRSAPLPIPRRPIPSPSLSLQLSPSEDLASPWQRSPPSRSPASLAPPGLAKFAQSTLVPGKPSSARFLGSPRDKDENRKSFIEIHQAQMREAEGQAFAKAHRSVSAASAHDWDESKQAPIQDSPPTPSAALVKSPESQSPRKQNDGSPTSVYSSSSQILSSGAPRERDDGASSHSHNVMIPASLQYQPSVYRSTDAGPLVQAYETFIARTRHLYELFRLHSETVRPLMASDPDQAVRAALWWFLKGRTGLEAIIRGPSPDSPQTQIQNDIEKHQAYSNLAKAYWLSEVVLPSVAESRGIYPDADIIEATKALVSGLKKLAFSMKRNGLMPPEDAFLPQTVDKSIWIEYPKISQDLVSLLSGRWDNGDDGAIQTPPAYLDMVEAFPLGDTVDLFCFSRVHVDAFLMEQDEGGQPLRFQCLLSLVRPTKKINLMFVLASQNGDIQLKIQDNRNAGPLLNDIRWRPEETALDIRLRRGYFLRVRCSKSDYRTLWSMYDFSKKVQNMLVAQNDEMVIFRSRLATFQYCDSNPDSRMFPKGTVDHCDVALFEKVLREGSGNVVRFHHRGYRVAVVTGPKTRSMSGVVHFYQPGVPIQFSFPRSDNGAPGLLLRFENSRQKGHMILTFNDQTELLRFHTLILGTALQHDERLVADVKIPSFTVSLRLNDDPGITALTRVPLRSAKIVNEETVGELPPTVNADRLRIVLDFEVGILTDRVNVGTGELRLRLEVSQRNTLSIRRQPQKDLTVSVFDAQVSRERSRSIGDALRVLSSQPTIRTFTFADAAGLHDFQLALTGCKVVFDGMACAFAIARRRMVVPIYKKWEAGKTRIQIVQQENKMLQMLVFFDGFSHAKCMNLSLRGTDAYEALHTRGKSGIKLIDAKFPLPGATGEGGLSSDAQIPDEFAFICLDLPDIAGEHDDISILFEDDKERDEFIAVLPAPVKGSSRFSTSRLK